MLSIANKRTVSFIIIILFTELVISAQEKTENQGYFHRAIKTETGLVNHASIDEIYSGHVYSGTGFIVFVEFENHKRIISTNTLGISSFKRYPNGDRNFEIPVEADNRLRVIKQLHFEVSSFHRIHLITLKKRLLVYAALDWFTSGDLIRNNSMTPELLLSTLAPGFYCEYKGQKQKLQLSVTTSLLSYTCRLNYSNVIPQDFENYSAWDLISSNSRIQGFTSFQSVFMNFSYEYELNRSFRLRAGYSFRYMNHDVPRNLQIVTGIYKAGLTYNFPVK